jgi:hypothetical protein
MTKPTKIEVNCTTGVETVVELTDEEMQEQATFEALRQNEINARQIEADRVAGLKASAKAKLVAGEPLTAEEADTLVI